MVAAATAVTFCRTAWAVPPRGRHGALLRGADQPGQGRVVAGVVEGVEHRLAQDVAVQLRRVGARPGDRLPVETGGEAEEERAHLGGRVGEAVRIAGRGGPLGELREVVLGAPFERGEPGAFRVDGVRVVVAVQDHAVGALREQLEVGGADIGAVGHAPRGHLALTERGAHAVEVAGLVEGADVPDELAAVARAGVGHALARGHGRVDGSVRGGPGKQGRPGQVPLLEPAVDGRRGRHPARREPDQVIGVPHRLRQLLPLPGRVVHAVTTGSAGDQQQGTAPGVRILAADTGDGDLDLRAVRVGVVHGHGDGRAPLTRIETAALALGPLQRLGAGGGGGGERGQDTEDDTRGGGDQGEAFRHLLHGQSLADRAPRPHPVNCPIPRGFTPKDSRVRPPPGCSENGRSGSGCVCAGSVASESPTTEARQWWRPVWW